MSMEIGGKQMARKNYNKMYEENSKVAPAEEPVVEPAEAELKVEASEEVKETPITKPFMGVVTGGLNLNVRKSPNGEIIAVIPEGAQVRVLEDLDGWYKIESPKGFVMKKFIKKG